MFGKKNYFIKKNLLKKKYFNIFKSELNKELNVSLNKAKVKNISKISIDSKLLILEELDRQLIQNLYQKFKKFVFFKKILKDKSLNKFLKIFFKNKKYNVDTCISRIDLANNHDWVLDWHQEISYSKCKLFLWFPILHDNYNNDGGLLIYKKKLKKELESRLIKKKNKQIQHKLKKRINANDIVKISLSIGDALAFNQYCAHKSILNKSKAAKCSAVISYYI